MGERNVSFENLYWKFLTKTNCDYFRTKREDLFIINLCDVKIEEKYFKTLCSILLAGFQTQKNYRNIYITIRQKKKEIIMIRTLCKYIYTRVD